MFSNEQRMDWTSFCYYLTKYKLRLRNPCSKKKGVLNVVIIKMKNNSLVWFYQICVTRDIFRLIDNK